MKTTTPAPEGATLTNDVHAKRHAAREAIRERAAYNADKRCIEVSSWTDAAAELLVEANDDRDRLAAELASVKAGRTAELDRAYDEGWNEGCGAGAGS